jgi:2-methylcitrate dehydratase
LTSSAAERRADKRIVRSKEEADHSLPYLIAAALLDGEVMPAQFAPDRIRRADVQELLRKVRVRPSDEFSARFPEELPCRLTLNLRDGRTISIEKGDYEGFITRPATWESALRKFQGLAEGHASSSVRDQIGRAVAGLEQINLRDLTGVLGRLTPAPQEQEKGAIQYGR